MKQYEMYSSEPVFLKDKFQDTERLTSEESSIEGSWEEETIVQNKPQEDNDCKELVELFSFGLNDTTAIPNIIKEIKVHLASGNKTENRSRKLMGKSVESIFSKLEQFIAVNN